MTARLLLAAPESGSGKTIITAGLGLALRRRGLQVQMFKAGPDYIDPSYHRLASGRPCRNLDSWMIGPAAIGESFQRNSRDADVAIIEGVMGLFDGFGVETNEGSSAELAHLLQAPVILILPVRGQARSAAATVLGFDRFSADLNISGVILNRCGSLRHAELCQRAIEKETGVPVLGYLPRNEAFILPERHLGLVPTNEEGQWFAVLEKVAAQLEATVDIKRLLTIAESAPVLGKPSPLSQRLEGEEILKPSPPGPLSQRLEGEKRLPLPQGEGRGEGSQPVRIAIAEDAAFSFTYPENIELLREAGAEIVTFSPLHDEALPENIDGLILSGGFPEIYAEALSENVAMRYAVLGAVEAGLPIYAECGGLMYLTEAITDHAGKRRPMVAALSGECTMSRRVKLGYRLVEAVHDSPVLLAGERVRGHEFHYSTFESHTPPAPVWYLHDPRGKRPDVLPDGVQHGSIWASYIHLHFLTKPEMATRMVNWCQHNRRRDDQ